MPGTFDPDKYLANKKFDPDAYLATPPTPVEPTTLESAVDYVKSLSGLPGYVAGSVPVLGPAAQRAGEYAGAALKTITSGGNYGDFEKERARQQQLTEQDRAKFEQMHPALALGGGVVGAAMLPGVPVAKGAGLLSKTGSALGSLALTGGETALDAALRGRDAEEQALQSTGTQAGLMGLLATIKGVGKILPRIVTGVKGETVAKYKARAPQIRAESEEALVQDVIAAREKSVVEPMEQAKKAAETAKEAADQAKMLYREELKGREVPPELTQEIFQGTKDARAVAGAASSRGFDRLKESGEKIKTAPLIEKLESKMEQFKIGGKVHPGDQASHDVLQREVDFLKEMGDEISPEDGKRLVQALDRMEEQAWDTAAQAGGYVQRSDRAIMDYRREVDAHLKQIPGYREEMEKASHATNALDEFRKVIGKSEKQIESALKTPSRFKEQAIAGLEGVTGKEYTSKLKPLREAQEILQTPTRYAEEVSRLPEVQARAAAERAAEDAALWAKPVQHLGDTGGVQSALRRVESEVRPDLKNIHALDYLGELSGQDFLQRAEDLAVKRALEQGFTRGSRNVNLGGLSLSGAMRAGANLLGGDPSQAAGFGAALGGILGGAADIFGPKVYRKFLDMQLNPKLAPYFTAIYKAAQRGPQAVAQAHQQLMENDPEYRNYIASP